MKTLTKTFTAATVALLTLSGSAFAAAHAEFDADAARLDLTLDTNGDGEVTDDEIIEGNMELFDTNGDGVLDVVERQEAEAMLEN